MARTPLCTSVSGTNGYTVPAGKYFIGHVLANGYAAQNEVFVNGVRVGVIGMAGGSPYVDYVEKIPIVLGSGQQITIKNIAGAAQSAGLTGFLYDN